MQKYFTDETEYFLDVIRCAVKGEKPEPPSVSIDWSGLITLSKRQEAYSLIAAVLPEEYLPKEEAERLNNYHKSELVRIIAVKNELAALKEELADAGISFMLLKGSRLKEYYPKESMRQMSDIDILYDVNKRKALIDIMKAYKYTLVSWSENSDDFHKEPYYTFEFHRELFFDDYGFCPDFSFVWDNAVPAADNPYEQLMSNEDMYLHSIAHLYKHNLLGGFGIRFLCDLYLMLTKQENMDFKYISEKLEEMGLAEFEDFIKKLTFTIFDGGEFDVEQLEFLSTMMDFGIYGDKTVGRRLMYERFKKETNSTSMFKYVALRMFPKSEYMKRTYSVLNDKPYLLPFYYIKRLVEKTANSSDRAVEEIKTIGKIRSEEEK